MPTFRCMVILIASAASLFQNVDANSYARRDPINSISLVAQPVIHTPSHRVRTTSHFDLTFGLHQKRQRIKLTLEPNHDILSHAAQIKLLDGDGNIRRTERIKRDEHKVFKGWSWVQLDSGAWDRVGWTRITIREDGAHPLFEGTFSVMHDHHQIMLKSNYMRTKQQHDPHLEDTDSEYMVIFRDSDIGRQTYENKKRSVLSSNYCGAGSLPFNVERSQFAPPLQQNITTNLWNSVSLDSIFGLNKRQSDNRASSDSTSNFANTAGCPTTRKVALIGVTADCSYTASFTSEDDVRRSIIDFVNSASQVFESTFNISLSLGDIDIFPRDCPSSAPSSARFNIGCGERVGENPLSLFARLNFFSAWRGKKEDKFAFWTLVTTCASGPEVGLAWLDQLCNNEVRGYQNPVNETQQAVSGTNAVVRTQSNWQVFAHEAAHVFGAVHDCTDDLCRNPRNSETGRCCPFSSSSCDADGRFLMNPTSSGGITAFSDCTKPLPQSNAAMELLRRARNATAAVNHLVEVISAVTGIHVGLFRALNVMTQTMSVVLVADFHQAIQYAEQASVLAIQKRGAQEIPVHVHETSTTQIIKTVEMAYSAQASHVMTEPVQYIADPQEEHVGKGQCEGSSFGNEVKAWVDQNKSLVIGLAAGLGGIVILLILGCVVRRCRRPRPKNRKMTPISMGPMPPGYGRWTGAPPPPVLAPRGHPETSSPHPYPPAPFGSHGQMPSMRYA
ncbi:hypothetical protein FQN57_000716 [Myotisia sp. PD_48]|nr:hypothetical protein FQN57_000716 [Myotisia sp. PD_48]